MNRPRVVIGLSAVIVAVTEEAPFVLVTRGARDLTALPFGPFDPAGDRTLELSLRAWVSEQTGFDIGYVEQLYTFGDRGREAPLTDLDSAGLSHDRVISIGYLALTPRRAALDRPGALWRCWYDYFPWEDWRKGRPRVIDAAIAPRLKAWAESASDQKETRWSRARLAFALEGANWNEERALDRYELLYEANLAPEAARDDARFRGRDAPEIGPAPLAPGFGEAMASDHRRILATALSRLRAKIKYRPVIFELAPELFTLLHLQRLVESIAGLELHKQNFRRLLDRTGLVEGAGRFDASAGGRPAELFRFRRETIARRSIGGVHVPAPRGE
ncbi:MAG: NAD regulator [Hyphomonadaceae bacterium]